MDCGIFSFVRILTVPHGTEKTLKAKHMVSMKMGDENFRDFAWFNATFLDLNL